MQKKFALTVLLATALFIGAYGAWTTWVNPRPAVVAEDSSAVQNVSPAPAITPSPTIVTAPLNKDGVPQKLGTLTLTKTELGQGARQEFEQMHRQGFDLLGSYRADYASADSRAPLWVGQAKDADAAQTFVKKMADKIGAGNPMFTNLQGLSIANRTLYQAEGQGQAHFFYAVNDKSVWLAVDPAAALDVLHALWRAIK